MMKIGILLAAVLLMPALACGDTTAAASCETTSDCSAGGTRCYEKKCLNQECVKGTDCGSSGFDCENGACVKHCPGADIGKRCTAVHGLAGTCVPTTTTTLCYPSCGVGGKCAFPFSVCEGSSKLCGLPAGW